MTRNLQDALEIQKKQTERSRSRFAGLLGTPLGGQKRVEVANRNGYVYVRLRSNQSEVIQVYNNKVATSYGLPVWVVRKGNKYVVEGFDDSRYENNLASQSPFLPRHGNTHSLDVESRGGGDVVWVYPRQIMPLLVMPSGSSGADGLIVNSQIIKNDNNTWKSVGNTGTASFLPYLPTSPTGAIMALVCLETTSGNPILLINSGTVFLNSITGSSQIAQYVPALTDPFTQIPLAAVRLITGSNQLSWDNIYDVRQWIHAIPTGSAGGGGGTINTGTLNSLYLRLDTSNDPLTHELAISITSKTENILNGTSTIGQGDADSAAAISLTRTGGSIPTGTGAAYSGYGLLLLDVHPNIVYSGGTILHYRNRNLIDVNPYADNIATFDSFGGVSPTGTLLRLKNNNALKFSVDGNGAPNIPAGQTYNINGSPHTHDAGGANSDGWTSHTGTWSYSGADDPTYTLTIDSNLTGTIGVGDRIKLTQTTAKYFIVTATSYSSPNTTLTLYGGTNYDLTSGTISSPCYSHVKNPFGFPLNPSLWTYAITDTTNRNRSNPAQDTWYNLGSVSIDIPIGIWRARYHVCLQISDETTSSYAGGVTLSTANNSESDSSMTRMAQAYLGGGGTWRLPMIWEGVIVAATKTTYYINSVATSAGVAGIANRNDISALVISMECAYL